MGSEWKEYTLGELTTWSSGGTPPKLNDEFWGGDIPWISASSMNGTRYSDSKLKLTDEGLKAGSKVAPKNSILLLVRGSILHQKIQVGIAERDLSFNQDVKCLIPKEELVEPWFLLSWFIANEKYLLSKVESTGIGAGKLDTKLMQELVLRVPPTAERKKITTLSKAIDDKIQLNRQTNQTLEQMAQALFKNWFVDFDPVIDNALAAGNPIPEPFAKRAKVRKALLDKTLPEEQRALFPSEFEETEELGWVPKGWKITPFIKIIDKYIDNRGKTPPLVEVGIPLVEVKNMIDGEPFPNLDTKKRVTMETFNTWFRTHLEKKDILISTVGTIGRTSIVANTNFGIAQNVLGLRFGKKVTPEYMFYTIKAHRFQYDMDARLVTTVQSSIKRKDLNTIPILKPPFELLEEFSSICDNNLKFQFQKKMEIGTLTKLRDTLLPKLISGELRLPETDSVHKKTSDTAA